MIRTDEIIKQAFDFANIVPYGLAMSDNRKAEGLRLLRGNMARYSNDDLLCVYEDNGTFIPTMSNIVIHDIAKGDIYGVDGSCIVIGRRDDYPMVEQYCTKGTIDNDTGTFTGTAIFVQEDATWYSEDENGTMRAYRGTVSPTGMDGNPLPETSDLFGEYPLYESNIAKVKAISTGGTELTFVPLTQWKTTCISPKWTQKDSADGHTVILVDTLSPLTMTWNKGLSVDDEEQNIPDIYAQLLIYGLAVTLAIKYPRDDNATTRLQSEYANILNNCRTPLANRRLVTRHDSLCVSDLLTGRGMF